MKNTVALRGMLAVAAMLVCSQADVQACDGKKPKPGPSSPAPEPPSGSY